MLIQRATRFFAGVTGAHLALLCLAGILADGALMAQPSQTRVMDTVYLADGSRFDGYIQFEWQSFVASKVPIAPQSKLVRVINGALDITLAPTVNAGYTAFYRVRYFSNGRVRYTEFWDIPVSSTTLGIADVRLDRAPAPSNGSGNNPNPNPNPDPDPDPGPGFMLPLAQSDIVDLPADMDDRPVKGPNFFPSRTVFVNSDGALEVISGSPTDCVRVDGTSVPCGEAATYLVDGEVPQGEISGINSIYTLAGTPTPPESMQVFRNGVLQRAGVDYAIFGNVVQFLVGAVPQPGDQLSAYYRTFQTTGAPISGAGLLPQVLCSKTGASTQSDAFADLGACTLGGGLLFPGDRLEVHFDFAMSGVSPGAYDIQAVWAGTPVYTRTFTSGDATASGSVRVSIGASTRQFSAQSHGATSAIHVATGTLSLPVSAFQLVFRGKLASAGDREITLTNFAVVRYPGVDGQ